MTRFVFVILFLFFFVTGCIPQSRPIESPVSASVPDPNSISETEIKIITAIESSFGSAEQDQHGKIIGIDLAKDRSSATDAVLREVLKLPDLKRFRLAGGNISSEILAEISKQKMLQEIYLQDLSIDSEKLNPILLSLPKLQHLTLRRLTALSTLPHFPLLRNLALIEMNLTKPVFQSIIEQKTLTALDIRNCSGLETDDYRNIKLLNQLTDLKIGGFAVNDDILEVVTPIPNLTGFTIDDTFITPDGFAKFAANSPSASTLETLIFNRNSAIMDDTFSSTLIHFPKLKRLTVCGMMITGSFLGQLADNEVTRPKLKQLSLKKSLLIPEEAEALKKYSELRSLNLSGVGLSSELVEIILSLDSLEELDIRDCSFEGNLVAPFQKMKSLRKLLY